MAPLRGWAPRGQRLPAKVPHGRWKTMTFLAALRHDRVEAPWLIDGPINGECFTAYVEKVLLPTLRPATSSSWTISARTRGKRRAREPSAPPGQALLPAQYSPDLNPIEMLFAKLKHLLRKAARRTDDTVCNAIAEILPHHFTSNAPTTSNRPGMTQPNIIPL